MKVRIDYKNKAKLVDKLDFLQPGYSKRRVTLSNVFNLSSQAEMHLEKKGIPKKIRKGAEFTYQEQLNCNSYGYRAESTKVRIIRGSKHWFMIYLRREYISTMNNYPNEIEFTPN